MKRITLTLLLAAVSLTFLAMPVMAATNHGTVSWRTVGPLSLSIGGSRTTVGTDSTARNFNTVAFPGGAIDTTLSYTFGSDMVWSDLADSAEVLVMVTRVGGTAGGSTDTVQVALQVSYAGLASASFVPVFAQGGNDWGFSTCALVGAGDGGNARFVLGATAVCLEATNGAHHIIGPAYGARNFRVLCVSNSEAADPGRFSVFVRYPIMKAN